MKKAIVVLLCTFLFGSCKKEKVEEPYTCNLTGKVYQFDQYGNELTTGLGNVSVKIEGTAYSTTTDASGQYNFEGIEPGVYDLEFTKTNCGPWKHQRFPLKSKGTSYFNGFAVEKPSYSLSNCLVKDSSVAGVSKIYFKTDITPVNQTTGMVLIMGRTPDVDINNPSSIFNWYIHKIPPNYSSSGEIIGSPKGKLYIKVYPHAYVSMSGYYGSSETNSPTSSYGAVYPVTFTVNLQ